MGFIFKLIPDQYTELPIIKEDLEGKTTIVTGANVGLGLEAARHFASMTPGRLILACRSQEKGDAAVKDIKATTSCSRVECWTLDKADFASVKAFSDRFYKEGGGRLDFLVDNAGVTSTKYSKTRDGWEQTLQVNYLSTALLGLLLLPALSKTVPTGPSPRMIVVSSTAYRFAEELKETEKGNIIEKLSSEEYCMANQMVEPYKVSRLLNIFWVRALAAHLKPGSPVTVNTPSHELSYLQEKFMKTLYFLLARTPEMGSRNYLYAALSGKRDEMHGKFLSNCRDEGLSEHVTSLEGMNLETRIWVETRDILSKVDPSVGEILKEYAL